MLTCDRWTSASVLPTQLFFRQICILILIRTLASFNIENSIRTALFVCQLYIIQPFFWLFFLENSGNTDGRSGNHMFWSSPKNKLNAFKLISLYFKSYKNN